MCRIAGLICQGPNGPSTIATLTQAQAHGGPDGQGIFQDPTHGVYLGHRRLSIIDLSEGGSQPMFSEDGNLVLVFNGEIYNYLELKSQLISLGYGFRSTSDTEVILQAFRAWGPAAFGKLNGMFAIGLYDQSAQKLYLTRDHAGMKPLYYSLEGGELFFASEVRAFRAARPQWPTNPDWRALFLSFGFLPFPYTTLRGVFSLRQGTWMEIDVRSLAHTSQPFAPLVMRAVATKPAEVLAQAREQLQAAVERHLLADAPLGVFLSGGIDSSLLTLLAVKSKPDLRTLSVTFAEATFSEAAYQQMVLARMPASAQQHHRSIRLGYEDFMAGLPDILAALDQPSLDGVNSYFIAKAAHESGLKAVLSGAGADEWFGGYPSFGRAGWLAPLRRSPNLLLKTLGRVDQPKLARVGFLALPSPVGDYLFLRGIFAPALVAQLLGCSEGSIWELLAKVGTNYPKPQQYDQAYIAGLESGFYLQNQLLKDADYMSMWHALEVRLPFLDREVLQWVQQVPAAIRFDPASPKYLLSKAHEQLLPSQVVFRQKQGFTFPFQLWLRQALTEGRLPTKLASNQKMKAIQAQFLAGEAHWSRVWSLCVEQQFDHST
jgi:asparagine synthase (glutamine-hydrolysing)